MDVLTAQQLMARIWAANPTVAFASPRLVRRAIRQSGRVRPTRATTPHRHGMVGPRNGILRVLDRSDLDFVGSELAPVVILLERPTDRILARLGPERALRRWWRLAFHSRIHWALEQRGFDRRAELATVRDRIDALGQTAFDEVRSVLRDEHLLLDSPTGPEEYVEFAATFLELEFFAPHLVPRYFPSLGDERERVKTILRRDVDVDALLLASKPAGATRVDPEPARKVRRRRRPAKRVSVRRAERAAKVGNLVRAALISVTQESGEVISHGAHPYLERLARALKSAVGFSDSEERQWLKGFKSLLRAGPGFRSPEARVLYDIQKACVDHHRGVVALDVVGWMISLGKRPLRRPRPLLRDIQVCRHLRSARKRLGRVVMDFDSLETLEPLLMAAEETIEGRVRRKCRPLLESDLDESGFVAPGTLPWLARECIEDELLDRVVAQGQLSLGDVRDAFSRNSLKLPDVTTPSDLWSSVRLLDLDRRLHRTLDGIYRRGEIYLRWLQRASALMFGTGVGRVLVTYVVIPFGGAFVLLSFLSHLLSAAVRPLTGQEVHLVDSGHPFQWSNAPWLLLGVWGLLLLRSPLFRSQHVRLGQSIMAAGRWVKGTVRARVFEPLRRFFRDHLRLAWTLWAVGLPLLLALGPWWVVMWLAPPALKIWWTLLVFGISILLVHTRGGRSATEWLADGLRRGWYGFRTTLVVGLLRWFISVFRWAMDALERGLYTVDEWLRFRTEEARWTVAVKAVLGVVWTVVSYALRLLVTLFLEPQLNPVKHFPVVTVAHKFMLPVLPEMIGLLNPLFVPVLGSWLGSAASGALVTIFPGVFGFLVWELKENWRLFRANRGRWLRPAVVGGHGETLPRLLRPGFHSGTLPKAFARLRRAARAQEPADRILSSRRYEEAVHHVEADVTAFTERQLRRLLEAGGVPGSAEMVVEVQARSNRLTVSIRSPGNTDPWSFVLEEQSGWIVAGVLKMGWRATLSPDAAHRVEQAFGRFLALSGVELRRDTLEVALGNPAPPYDISDRGLLVWPGPGFEIEECRPLDPFQLPRWPIDDGAVEGPLRNDDPPGR